LIYDAACLIAGLYPFANPSEKVRRVIADPSLKFFRRHLRTDLARMLLAQTQARS
jgi:hypothetical protein